MLFVLNDLKWCSGNHRIMFFNKGSKKIVFVSKNYKTLLKEFKKKLDIFLNMKRKEKTAEVIDYELEEIKNANYLKIDINIVKRIVDSKNEYNKYSIIYNNRIFDLDNYCKTLFDILIKCGIIDNDVKIVKINAKKTLKKAKEASKRNFYDFKFKIKSI